MNNEYRIRNIELGAAIAQPDEVKMNIEYRT